MTLDGFQKIAPNVIAILAVTIAPILIARRAAADNISAKRQNWIDELRRDAAAFLQTLRHLEGLRRPTPNLPLSDQKKTFEERTQAEVRAIELGHRITLRLNPSEAIHNHLLELIAGLAALCKDPPPDETDAQRKALERAFTKQEQRIIRHLGIILKKEWERIKRGEMSSRMGRARYRVGFFRLWLIISLLWIGSAAWDIDLLCLFGVSFGDKPWCAYPSLMYPAAVAVRTVTTLFGPPLVLSVVLAGSVWIATGFWPREQTYHGQEDQEKPCGAHRD